MSLLIALGFVTFMAVLSSPILEGQLDGQTVLIVPCPKTMTTGQLRNECSMI